MGLPRGLSGAQRLKNSGVSVGVEAVLSSVWGFRVF